MPEHIRPDTTHVDENRRVALDEQKILERVTPLAPLAARIVAANHDRVRRCVDFSEELDELSDLQIAYVRERRVLDLTHQPILWVEVGRPYETKNPNKREESEEEIR